MLLLRGCIFTIITPQNNLIKYLWHLLISIRYLEGLCEDRKYLKQRVNKLHNTQLLSALFEAHIMCDDKLKQTVFITPEENKDGRI